MVLADIKRAYSDMHGAERKVADFVLAYPQRVTQMSMAELSSETETSDATIMRMCRRIDQSGFYQLKINLAMEANDASSSLDANLADESAPTDVVSLVDVIAANVAQLSKDISMEQVEECVNLIAGAHTVFSFGWGNTSTVAEDFAQRVLRYGASTFTSNNMEYMMRGIVLAESNDVLVAFSRSGESIYTVECCKLARATGLKIIAVTGDERSSVAKLADLVLIARPVNDVMDSWGNTSHAYELVVVDILLYFLKDRLPTYELGTKSEAILGQFKN